ncbi:hypothetical protein K437DRAFT_46404 [Tilletiaria anomala UBC 951]|uniref:Uncharacterized protein n=1 Tax=Tilletiaria anomala (strain ATCC 24038 / CBS 436.72 / UBC 951) TaxID=1037660 RepID=A0A066WN21_TILAU|nr:uncharacterized protein K437DRAFT_46404 [Tilletiaria anomala UBC 951]KDN52030.1 hypothetical protein K437DRAFT_46404 [Tilletiaria anomala UBC 951]
MAVAAASASAEAVIVAPETEVPAPSFGHSTKMENSLSNATIRPSEPATFVDRKAITTGTPKDEAEASTSAHKLGDMQPARRASTGAATSTTSATCPSASAEPMKVVKDPRTSYDMTSSGSLPSLDVRSSVPGGSRPTGLASRFMNPSSSKSSIDVASGLRSISAAAAAAASPSSSNTAQSVSVLGATPSFPAPPPAAPSSSKPGAAAMAASAMSSTLSSIASPSTWMPSLQSHASHGSSQLEQKDKDREGIAPPSSLPPSILLNPLASSKAANVVWTTEGKDGTLHTKIPAVPSEKDKAEERARIAREKEKQREKEREMREKELAKERERLAEKEKVWGIPKKALMLGMGDINFNAQMAILGGWGNGSGTQTVLPVVDKKREREKQRERQRMEEQEREMMRQSKEDASKPGKEQKAEEEEEAEDELDEPLDPEELAAINAIINTRRSMEAAQALASGQVKMRRRSSAGGTVLRLEGAEDENEDEDEPSGVSAKLLRSSSRSSATRERHMRAQPSSSSAAPSTTSAQGGAASVLSVPDDGVSVISAPPSPTLASQELRSPKIRFAPFPDAHWEVGSLDDFQRPAAASMMMHDESSNSIVLTPNSSGSGKGGGLASALGAGILSSGLLLGSIPASKESTDALANGNENGKNVQVGEAMDRGLGLSSGAASLTSVETATLEIKTISSAARLSPSVAPDDGCGLPSVAVASSAAYEQVSPLHTAPAASSAQPLLRPRRMERADSMTSKSACDSDDDSDFGRWGRSKWYLMGMPSGIFKPVAYKGLLYSKRKYHREDAEALSKEALSAPLVRRISTGTLGLMSSMESDRRSRAERQQLGDNMQWPSSAMSRERSFKRKGWQRSTRSRPSSRSGSGDEDERLDRRRRRDLILAARPGGTGMVTLLDGTKIKARRVDDPDVDLGDVSYDEWGYALLAREARRSMAIEPSRGSFEEAATGQRMKAETGAAQDDAASLTTMPPHLLGDSSSIASPASAGQVVTSSSEGPKRPVPQRKTTLGLGLPLEKAEEVRRRHEEEVAALGWEVIHNAHKQNHAKRQASMSESVKTIASQSTEEDRERENQFTAVPESGSSTPSAPTSKERLINAPQRTSAMRNDLRKTNSNEDRHLHRTSTPPRRVPRGSSPSASNVPSTPAQAKVESAYLSLLPVDKNKLGDPSISLPTPSPLLPRKPDAKGHMVVPLPLPQLGRRPDRPQEGRSWMGVDSILLPESPEPESISSDEETASERRRRGDQPEAEEEEEEEDGGLNAEEEAEEERKTAIQKKRATTRAAGQEIVHPSTASYKTKSPLNCSSRHATRSHHRRAASEMATTDKTVGLADDDYEDDAWYEPARPRQPGPSPAGRRDPLRSTCSDRGLSEVAMRHSKSHGRMASSQRLSRSPDPYGRLGGFRRTSRSCSTRSLASSHTDDHGDGDDGTPVDDDADLWSQGAVSSIGLVEKGEDGKKIRPGAAASNLSKAAAVAAQAKARVVRERRIKEEKEMERRLHIEKLKADDEFLNYGWPRSLKGSLY